MNRNLKKIDEGIWTHRGLSTNFKPILEQWIEMMKEYSKWHYWGDLPYFYLERTNLGLFLPLYGSLMGMPLKSGIHQRGKKVKNILGG